MARLLESQPRPSAAAEALEHLAGAEARMLALANGGAPGPDPGAGRAEAREHFAFEKERAVAVTAFRRDMGRVCQAGLQRGEDVERLKTMYRRVLRNEPLAIGSHN
mmetsp:Transcript_60462/g.170352  ORF Transcript_60462/g.170352 Transcript_60462/m.170352 type:complete len:106 (+) Transcript_60462:2-319(+)